MFRSLLKKHFNNALEEFISSTGPQRPNDGQEFFILVDGDWKRAHFYANHSKVKGPGFTYYDRANNEYYIKFHEVEQWQ